MRFPGPYLSVPGSSYTVRVSVSDKQIKNSRVTSVDKVLKTPCIKCLFETVKLSLVSVGRPDIFHDKILPKSNLALYEKIRFLS